MDPTGAACVLTAAQFEQEVTQHGGDIAWRRVQVERVLASFEVAKWVMSRYLTREVHKYIESGKWIQHCTSLCQHPAYRRFVGTDRPQLKSLYYPHFFVVQAIFILGGRRTGSAVDRLYEELSAHWGMTINPDEPFYPPRLADSEKERRLILGNIQGPSAPSERQSTSEDEQKDDKHKELSVHLKAAAQLSKKIQNEDAVNQRRSMDLQRMRDEMRHLQQANLELQRELQQETQNRRNEERSKQALQNRLEQRIEQLQDAQTQLQQTNQRLVESRRHAQGLQHQLNQIQAYITHHQQISLQITELEKQHKALSAKRQQCVDIMAQQTVSRVEGSRSATKRPADRIADGEEPKRPRQN